MCGVILNPNIIFVKETGLRLFSLIELFFGGNIPNTKW